MPEHPVRRPARHPFLIMNPKSGGGKVGSFDLRRRAEHLGAEVFMLDGDEPVDVAEVAREAVARGADLLGVAGGDGTQALVAGIAAEHGIPFLVITAGTRNHFALDLGLDRDDPAACLGALSDAVELRVDLGEIGGLLSQFAITRRVSTARRWRTLQRSRCRWVRTRSFSMRAR